MIPQLRDLEHRFPGDVIVIGVHSGKYTAERDTSRIRDAAIRLGNTHAIVNDRQFRTWRSYAVQAWPTLVVVDSEGKVLGNHAGEFTAEALTPFLEELIARSRQCGTLTPGALPLAPDAPAIAPGELRYPGKVVVDGRRIAIADTGHRRVLVGTLDESGRTMRIDRVVGEGAARGAGADHGDATFASPQGMAFDDGTLYVADALHHTIEAVDLGTGAVRRVAGVGHQLRTREDLRAGALASPWDVALVGRTLFIAMAGTHQLYALDVGSGALRIHCGNRAEALVDGPLADASLAQPMALVAAGERLYFADAESSAIRWADVDPGGRVGTIVGTGLFDFGDVDGTGEAVRMQHQQGVALHASGRLLVADSYNDALKWVDPSTRRAQTWVRGFHEPAGVACGERYAYVADTNAHRIATVDYGSGAVAALGIG